MSYISLIPYFSHILLCNILTTILKPNFEKPIDTAQDLVDNNIKLIVYPGDQILQPFLAESPISSYKKLSESVYFTYSSKEVTEVLYKKVLIEVISHISSSSSKMNRYCKYLLKETFFIKYVYATIYAQTLKSLWFFSVNWT